MQKYPDKIVILEAKEGGDPFHPKDLTTVYGGKCRCYLNKPAAFRTSKIMDCDYGVVIPDRTMIDIGENFVVGIKFHNSKSGNQWDIVGFVKDFARYDRVCNIYFQMVKENIIGEDVPTGDNIPKDWPILKGIDFRYINFYHMQMKELPYWAFYADWSKVEKMDSRFEGCSQLTEVNVSTATGATSFKKTFYDCASLTNIILPERLTIVNDLTSTFSGCKSLEEIFIPKAQTSLYIDTFGPSRDDYGFIKNNCEKLRKIVFEDVSDLDFDGNPVNMKKCGWRQAFNGCTALEEVIVEGVIGGHGYNDFSNTGLAECPLTQECLSALIDALCFDPPHNIIHETENGNRIDILTDAFNIGQENIKKLSPRDLILAEQKGWVIT